MSEEEKKAIIQLNHYINITTYWKHEEYSISEIDNYIKIVLNLIEKQQKEIEDLKNNELDYTSIYIKGKIDVRKNIKRK